MNPANRLSAALCAVLLAASGFFGVWNVVMAQQEAELESQIQAKTKELEDILARKREIERQLEETSGSTKKLSDELAKINATVNQLNLSIRQNRVMIEKLGLEINSLGKEMVSTEDGIRMKKATIGKLFAELQQRDGDTLLSIFLRNDSLSQGIAEAQSIESLNAELQVSLTELHALKGNLSRQLETQRDKKEIRESEQVDLKNRQYIVEDEKKGKQTLLTVTKNQEKLYEQQLTEFEKLQAEVSEEIDRIESELRKQIDRSLLPGKGVLGNPAPGTRLTQDYGRTAFAKRNYKSGYHNGVDFGAPVGTPVYAAEEGRVLAAMDQDRYCRKGAYGKFVLVKHLSGLTTLYGHLSRYTVSAGEKVTRGQLIGYIGSTGFATGPHLHFTVFATNTIPPASGGLPEGTQGSRVCGPMPVGGDLNPMSFLAL